MRVSRSPAINFYWGVAPKWFPMKIVMEVLDMIPTISTASRGKPRSSMKVSNRAWLMEPKAF